MTQRVLLLSSKVGSGHITAAAALERVFGRMPGVDVCNLDAMDFSTRLHQITYSGLYFPMARMAPWLMDWGYQASHRPFATEPLLPLWDRLNVAPLVRVIREYKPDIAICTHFMPARILGQLIARGELATSLSVVITDYDFHGIWLGRTFSRYFVALPETQAHACALGLPPERVVVSGIPVDPVFEQPFDRAALLAHYRLRPDQPIILLSAGAAGSGVVQQVVAQLLRARHDLQLLVVCGRNEALQHAIERLVARQSERVRVLGFSHEMPDLMRIATLFIGKPGGLTAAECMAAGLPMLIIDPLPGQEERNCDHLLEEGVALRCNELSTLSYKLERLLSEPGALASMQQRAARFGRPGAARIIAEVALAEPLVPIQLSRAQRQQIVAVADGK